VAADTAASDPKCASRRRAPTLETPSRAPERVSFIPGPASVQRVFELAGLIPGALALVQRRWSVGKADTASS
jgi:hypothetical protein